eukprot:14150_1
MNKMDDWISVRNVFQPRMHQIYPSTTNHTSGVAYLAMFIGFTVLGTLIVCVLRHMMCDQQKTTTSHVIRNPSKNIKICRCILYTLIASIIATVIFTLFGTNTVHHGVIHNESWQPQMATVNRLSAAKLNNNLGFAVGGAKTVSNFRDNINNHYLPLPTSITYEGLFYDYYFDTNIKQINECKQLFCPTYSRAISTHPLNDAAEYYLSVGLNSNIQTDQFKRKKLNLVVVLDVSGSMSTSFNRYYYDNKQQMDIDDDWATQSKIEIAKQSIVGLLAHLHDDDRFGMALFNNDGYIAKPLRLVSATDMDAIQKHILDISSGGGTNFEAGYRKASELFIALDADIRKDQEYENRIIFLTDAMPNIGNINEHHLLGLTKTNANNVTAGRIYSTFIGMGVDFQTDLIETITKIRGSNYYSVHSYQEFMTRMDKEFEYMVTPLVFNLELKLNSTRNRYEIEQVYGSPEADQASGCVMKVNTLFPSASNADAEVKGGVTLLKLKRNEEVEAGVDALELHVTYEDRNGEEHSNTVSVMFDDDEQNMFENNGIRKAVLLSRYVQLIKQWIVDETNTGDDHDGVNRWEHQSKPLQVNRKYKERISVFHEHFLQEMQQINDESLQKEVDIMHKLINVNPTQTR